MSNDDLKTAIALGCLIVALGFLQIAFRPIGKTIDEQRKELQQIMNAWGMKDPGTFSLVSGILCISIGAIVVSTALALKFAGAKP